MRYSRLWTGLGLVILISFAILGYYGGRIYQTMPPVPKKVVTTTGKVLFTEKDIKEGQNVWQSIGGQELGTIWGHGAYVAPDWNADWLHREAVWMLNRYAADQFKKPYQQLDDEKKAMLQARLKKEIRTNTYQPETGNLVISPLRAEAVSHISRHYSSLFGSDPKLDDLREKYAIPEGTVKNPGRMKSLNAFLFWSTWACATNRPGRDITYTNNWPHEPLIGNHPTGEMVLWSVVSFVLLLAGVGALAWYYATQQHDEIGSEDHFPEKDPLLALSPTPSIKATLKYFWVVGILWVIQVALGAVTAHYQIEGSGFYGIPITEWIPYSITRTWHTQLAIFWIATAWIATGLFVAPAVSGREPKHQRLLVNILFVCLVIIVIGSMAGQWYAVQERFGLKSNFWFGHQGYEYTDLGRFWQLFLTIGLFLWLFFDVAGNLAGTEKETKRQTFAHFVHDCIHRHSLVLHPRPDVGSTHAFGHRRILALVGGPSVGGRIF